MPLVDRLVFYPEKQLRAGASPGGRGAGGPGGARGRGAEGPLAPHAAPPPRYRCHVKKVNRLSARGKGGGGHPYR